MFGRRRVSLDASLLERVSDDREVGLGAYPEAVLAVTGIQRFESVAQEPESPSPFFRLDLHARKAAMTTALDGLIDDGTVGMAAGTTVKAAVAAARAGKLPVTGELGELYRLMYVVRSSQSVIMADLKGAEGHEVVEMPPGVPPPGMEFGYWVPFTGATTVILLVERPDFATGTRSYTLRTLRAQVSRIADFLFCDTRPAGAQTPGPTLQAHVHVMFRDKRGMVAADHSLTRSQGQERAVETMLVGGVTMFGAMKDEQTDMNISRTEFVNAMVAQFVDGTARMLRLAPPRWSAKHEG
jgi:hypothetical protein